MFIVLGESNSQKYVLGIYSTKEVAIEYIEEYVSIYPEDYVCFWVEERENIDKPLTLKFNEILM